MNTQVHSYIVIYAFVILLEKINKILHIMQEITKLKL